VIDDDAQTLGLLLSDAGQLELRKGETAALYSDGQLPFISPFGKSGLLTPDADVVALSRASNGWAETLEGLGASRESLLGARDTPALLLARLVELRRHELELTNSSQRNVPRS
jgi:hypothetical protein